MKYPAFFFFSLFIFGGCADESEHPVVVTKSGPVKGSKVKGLDENEYYSFLGIPYAAPPSGDFRFQDPQPVSPWAGVRDVLQEGPNCVQFDFLTNKIIGSEDCLYLNIATTSLTGKRPVMFWVHGGGFSMGSADRDLYGPDYLVTHDVVVITVNYRLGMMGFLNMGVEDCAGNQGPKDLVEALKWVKENAENFGGDPNNVLIFGNGALVHALCISPLAKGLFHKAIAQSGTMFNPWAHKRSNKEYGLEVSKALGLNSTDSREAVNYFRSKSETELVEMQQKLFTGPFTGVNMVLALTWDSTSKKPFFPEDISETKKPVEVPFMFGSNSKEYIMFQDTSPAKLKETNENFTSVFATDMHVEYSDVVEMAPKVRKHYFGDRNITERDLYELEQYLSDVMFNNGAQYLADVQASTSTPTYFYRFSFLASMPFTKWLFELVGKTHRVQGASHGDELHLLFFMRKFKNMIKLKENSRDRLVMERLTRMWTDFAKTGDPTPVIDDLISVKWQPFMEGKKNYLEISDELTVGVEPGKKAWQFWKPLIEELRSKI